MKAGDLVRFSQEHCNKPGLDYCTDWIGLLMDSTIDSEGDFKEICIFWKHGKVNDYQSTWWNRLSYFPFEVASEDR